MSYLIDINVISELIKNTPNSNVVRWFDAVSNDKLYLSVLTIGEIRKGISKVANLSKQEKYRLWLDEELMSWFYDRILPVNVAVANCWGRIAHNHNSAIDSLIAATAIHFDLALVTRNISDFNYQGLHLINPWILD